MNDDSRLEAIFARALDGPAHARRSFVAAACADDPAMEARVLRLLAAHEEGTGPLDEPLIALAAPLFAVDRALGDGSSNRRTDGLAPGTRVGSYAIVRQIGRGGMGTVHLAERADGAFEQRVAMKVIQPGPDDAASHERFLSERRILAGLQHPNIARLLDGGVTSDGRPYFAMEYVVGTPITQYCCARRLGVDAVLDLFLQVCDAVAYAHRRRVVHRDLKPSNILVTESEADAPRVKLLDFGIAKLLEPSLDDDALTRPGRHLLTPEYAVPEQLHGDPITTATDVYSLGLILYELLTGSRPFVLEKSSAAELARVVCEQEPRPPSAAVTLSGGAGEVEVKRLRRRLRGDLDAICLRALEKEPTRRYASVEALGEDIERHREGLPIRARRPAAGYRALRFAVRHRAEGAAAVGMALVMTVLTALLPSWRRVPSTDVRFNGESMISIGSASAARLHHEGLRMLTEDPYAAQRFFRASLAADSTFAPAAYQALRVEWALEMPQDTGLEARLRRLATGLPDRERLLMRARWAESESDPALPGLARRLVGEYPDDPEGHYLLGRALLARGDFDRGRARLRRAVTLDAEGLRGEASGCVGCHAYASLVSYLVAMDSLAAAERIAREWIARRSRGAMPAWFALAGTLEYQGRPEEALAAMRQTSPLQLTTPYLPIYPAILGIRDGNFTTADALLREQARAGSPNVQREALWFLTISLRYQGRLRAALRTARLLRGLDPGPNGRLAEAQVLLEMGRAGEAGTLFDSIASMPPEGISAGSASTHAHRLSFALIRVAIARHTAGDTLRLPALADSIEALGARTLALQRRRLHHHVRGLLYAARGDLQGAITAFRRSMAWPNHDYTRSNLDLARVLLALGRPREAVPILESAFHGPLETARFYVTHTELHELLGQALEEAGDPGRAATHYEWVLGAWRDADPEFGPRREEARRRLAALDPRNSPSTLR